MLWKKLSALILSATLAVSANASIPCHPKINEADTNYLIGYGSLMNDESRAVTNPTVKNVYPLLVKNYKRLWGIQVPHFKATFLLAVQAKGSQFNGVYYKVNADDLLATDAREETYCRIKVPRSYLKAMGLKTLPEGNFWIYSFKNKQAIKLPNKTHPITQNYVDIFINGCLQLQERYQVPNYANLCITTTHNWDENHWINDRTYPRRPTDTTPNVILIDKMLSKHFKYYFKHPYQ